MTRHAKERALERYGIELDIPLVIAKIRQNGAQMIYRVTKQKAIYELEHQGVKILVLYHRGSQAVITVLPADHYVNRLSAAVKEMNRQEQLAQRNLKAMDAWHEQAERTGTKVNPRDYLEGTFPKPTAEEIKDAMRKHGEMSLPGASVEDAIAGANKLAAAINNCQPTIRMELEHPAPPAFVRPGLADIDAMLEIWDKKKLNIEAERIPLRVRFLFWLADRFGYDIEVELKSEE